MNRGQRRAQWLAEHRQQLRGTRAAPRAAVIGRAATSATDGNVGNAESNVENNAGNVAQTSPASVRVHIEELVLHEFPPGARYSIGDATGQELTRLLTERGVPPQMSQAGETARVDAGSFQLKQGAQPAAVGALVANAVYGGTKR